MNLNRSLLVLILALIGFSGFAQQPPVDSSDVGHVRIFFVRHAEKVADSSSDPELSLIGKETAQRLSDYLKAHPIDAIYSTPYNRTKMTAYPLSQRIDKEVKIYDPRDPNSLLDIVRENMGKNVLIVGHSNTVPMMINFLAKEKVLENIPEDQYGDLYIVDYGEDKFNLTSLRI